jgi:hypothetical protein
MLHFGHVDLPENCTPRSIAENFARAEDIAETLEMTEFSRRARLRGGVILLRSGDGRDEGRELLREVDPQRLGRADSLWYAVGMAHSPFWLDRVRGADQDIGLADAPKSARKKGPQPQPADVEAAARCLLDSAPLQLQPLEADRLDELVDLLAAADDFTHLRANLDLRAHLDQLADLPLEQAGEAAEFMGADSSDAGRAAAHFCRILQNIFDGEAPAQPDAADLATIEEFHPLAATVITALFALATRDAAKLATALGSLEGKLRISQIQPAALKPIGLLWPSLLSYLGELRDASADAAVSVEPTTTKRITASAREIFARWIPEAPQPSYGWWKLSANLLATPEIDAPWPENAARCTLRALRDGICDDAELEARVLAKILDRAVEHAADDELLEWLEVAEKM